MELSLNVSDGWDEVDGTTGHKHGWLASKDKSGSAVDLLRGNLVDLLAVLVEGEITEGHVVTGNLLKSVLLSFHGHKDVHLENVLSASELLVGDSLLEAVELFKENSKEIL